MLNNNIGKQNMLKIIEGGEHINKNNEKVAQVTLEDKTVWQLTDYMFVEWDEFTHTTHEELIECGWEKRNLTTLQHIQNKLIEGYETMYLYIEDSFGYDTVTVNIKELLQALAIDESWTEEDGQYTIYCSGRNEDRQGNLLGIAQDNLYSNAAMLNVFADEEECFNFCVKYLIEFNEGEEEQLTLEEAKREVAAQSTGSFKYK